MKKIFLVAAFFAIQVASSNALANSFAQGICAPPNQESRITRIGATFVVPPYTDNAFKSYWVGLQSNGSLGASPNLVQAVVANPYRNGQWQMYGEWNNGSGDSQGTHYNVSAGDTVYEVVELYNVDPVYEYWYAQVQDYDTGQTASFYWTTYNEGSNVVSWIAQEWAKADGSTCSQFPSVQWTEVDQTYQPNLSPNYIQYLNYPWDTTINYITTGVEQDNGPSCAYNVTEGPETQTVTY